MKQGYKVRQLPVLAACVLTIWHWHLGSVSIPSQAVLTKTPSALNVLFFPFFFPLLRYYFSLVGMKLIAQVKSGEGHSRQTRMDLRRDLEFEFLPYNLHNQSSLTSLLAGILLKMVCESYCWTLGITRNASSPHQTVLMMYLTFYLSNFPLWMQTGCFWVFYLPILHYLILSFYNTCSLGCMSSHIQNNL